MKKCYLLCLALLLFQNADSQIINFPDAGFKSFLLYSSDTHLIVTNLAGEWIAIDANGDGEIEVSEAQNVASIDFFIWGPSIVDVTGIEYFTNLEQLKVESVTITGGLNFNTLTNFKELFADYSNIGSLDFSNCPGLITLRCANGQLTSLDLTGVNMLETLDVSGNQLTSLEVHAYNPDATFGYGLELMAGDNPLTSLIVDGYFSTINVIGNQLTSVDISNCTGNIDCYFGSNTLTSMNIKNGGRNYFIYPGEFPALQYICCDSGYEYSELAESIALSGVPVELNTFCSVTPGGTYFTLQGATHLDTDANGCDSGDAAYQHLSFNIMNQFNVQTTYIANATGNYTMWLPDGEYTITPQIANPSYFNISPSSYPIVLDAQVGPIFQDFCVTPNGSHPDVSVSIIPIEQARPGFDVDYKIMYTNVGSVSSDGSISLSFQDNLIDYVSSIPSIASQQMNQLDWSFTALAPFETRMIMLTLNLNGPTETPPLNDGDILQFTTEVDISGDENLQNNTALLAQTVVNSLDPNDKTCTEGSSVTPDIAGKYVNYTIRFENTGTADAINIFIKDVIDTTKFDISTLTSLDGSHTYFTRIDGNNVEFIFENINLPFDDASNDGYVSFKIKTLPTLTLGDTFSNTASIYFDYNFPIVTNTATTTIEMLGKNDFAFSDYFAVFPNPSNSVLNIQSKNYAQILSLSVYNLLGQLMMTVPDAGNVSKIDVSHLSNDKYFLKIITEMGTSTARFIKE